MSLGGGKTAPQDAQSTGSSAQGGSNWSSSNSSSESFQDPGFVWQQQAPFLQGLYQQGADMFGGAQMQQGMNRGNDMYNQAAGAMNQFMNPGINPQLQAYQGDVQRNFERNIMPAIGSQAAGTGQYGGSRHGVAQGIAAGDANRMVGDMASNLYNEDMSRMQQAMQFAPSLGGFGMSMPWFNMQQYGGLLGSPVSLSGAGGSTSSSSSEGGGESWGTSEQQSTSTGGGGWNAGVGFKP